MREKIEGKCERKAMENRDGRIVKEIHEESRGRSETRNEEREWGLEKGEKG